MAEETEMVSTKEIVDAYNLAIKKALPLNFLVHDSSLQQEQCETLEILKNQIKSYKYQAIESNDEEEANLLFHLQCVINSLISVFKMWIELKQQNYDLAWNKLIDAQDYISVALRASNKHRGINEFSEHLYKIERIVFPQWPYYNSPGIIKKGGECSICGKEYGSCEHIEDFVYMGRLCRRINQNIVKFDHGSIVESPKDKRCIIRYISTEDGKKQDYITWKILDEKFSHEVNREKYLLFEARILSFNNLDFD